MSYRPPHSIYTTPRRSNSTASSRYGANAEDDANRYSVPPAVLRKSGAPPGNSTGFPSFPSTSSAPPTFRSSSEPTSASARWHIGEHDGQFYDVRNDDSEMVCEEDVYGSPRQGRDDERSDLSVMAPPPAPSRPGPGRGGAGRHPMWHLTSFFTGGSPHPHPSVASRTPSPRPVSGYDDMPVSPPEPRRILCGSALFRDNDHRHGSGRRTTSNAAEDEECRDESSPFPVQARYQFGQPKRMSVQAPLPLCNHEMIGHPSFKIHRMRLPSHLLPLLDTIISGCEMHASNLRNGWQTDLYSLTKQDIALREIPHIYNAAKPIVSYIKKAAAFISGAKGVRMDRNQPHVLKYDCQNGRGHTGVELHHDKCDFTANLVLSRSDTYEGGGTYFPDADAVVRLERGSFLIHPGTLVHGGVNISHGSRYLMVMFMDKA